MTEFRPAPFHRKVEVSRVVTEVVQKKGAHAKPRRRKAPRYQGWLPVGRELEESVAYPQPFGRSEHDVWQPVSTVSKLLCAFAAWREPIPADRSPPDGAGPQQIDLASVVCVPHRPGASRTTPSCETFSNRWPTATREQPGTSTR